VARKQGRSVRFEDRGQRRWLIERPPGSVALAAARAAETPKTILAMPTQAPGKGLIVSTRGVEATHNLGAIVERRGGGAHGV